jgi:hypothetical protein
MTAKGYLVWSTAALCMLLRLSAGEHGILNIWDVNTAALGPQPSRQASFGSSSAAAAASKWAHLVGDPALLEELRDYFCYAQLLAQPQDTAGAYDITGVHCTMHDAHKGLLLCSLQLLQGTSQLSSRGMAACQPGASATVHGLKLMILLLLRRPCASLYAARPHESSRLLPIQCRHRQPHGPCGVPSSNGA